MLPFYCDRATVVGSLMRTLALVCMTSALSITACVQPLWVDAPNGSSTEPVGHNSVFSDDDLEDLLRSRRAGGLIYVWSPHMPYSVKGLRDMAVLGARVGMPVTPLLDPYAETTLSVRVVQEAELPREALRSLASPTLFARGATLHFPTLLVFAHGRLAEQMLPGYTSPAVYETFIEEQLAHIVLQDAYRQPLECARTSSSRPPGAGRRWLSCSQTTVSRR